MGAPVCMEKLYLTPLSYQLSGEVCKHSSHFVQGQICCGQHCERPCTRRLTYAVRDHSVRKRIRRLGHLLSHAGYSVHRVVLDTTGSRLISRQHL